MGQGVVRRTLPEGILFYEDPGDSKSAGGAQGRWRREGGGIGGFHFLYFHFPEKVKVVLVLSLLLFSCNLCQCLKRA